jgi:hypothetical protein
MKKPVPLRIPENLLSLAALKARRDRVDKATALRQILYAGAEAYTLQLLSQGELSLSRVAELLDLNPWEVLERAAAHGIEVGGTLAQHHAGKPSRVAEGPPGREVQSEKGAEAAHRIRSGKKRRGR